MTERSEPTPEVRKGKFESGRDEVLYRMATEAWGQASSGDVASPSFWFARVSNTPEEISELAAAFAEELVEAGVPDPSVLVGHYMILENSDGQVFVIPRDTLNEVMTDYALLEGVYQKWLGSSHA